MNKNYEEIWRSYPDGFGAPNAGLLDIIKNFPGEKAQQSIVDAGAGNGRYALAFEAMGFGRVIAIEMSKAGCDLIRRKRQNTHLEVQQQDIRSVAAAGDQDIVFSSGLIEEFGHARDQITAARLMQAMVKVGGLLILRHCLYISTRATKVRCSAELMPSLFTPNQWAIQQLATDPKPFPDIKAKVGSAPDWIQRQTIVAVKLAHT